MLKITLRAYQSGVRDISRSSSGSRHVSTLFANLHDHDAAACVQLISFGRFSLSLACLPLTKFVCVCVSMCVLIWRVSFRLPPPIELSFSPINEKVPQTEGCCLKHSMNYTRAQAPWIRTHWTRNRGLRFANQVVANCNCSSVEIEPVAFQQMPEPTCKMDANTSSRKWLAMPPNRRTGPSKRKGRKFLGKQG